MESLLFRKRAVKKKNRNIGVRSHTRLPAGRGPIAAGLLPFPPPPTFAPPSLFFLP